MCNIFEPKFLFDQLCYTTDLKKFLDMENLEEEFRDCRRGEGTQSLHQFTTEDIEKQHNVSLSDYRGQVLLVVNLASF